MFVVTIEERPDPNDLKFTPPYERTVQQLHPLEIYHQVFPALDVKKLIVELNGREFLP